MGFFDGLFNSKEHQPDSPFTSLDQSYSLNDIARLSETEPVVIFKHSPRCGISSMVLRSFEQQLPPNLNCTLFLLNVLTDRQLSRAIAEAYQVQHQSPQLLVIKDSEVIWHNSHSGINQVNLNELIP